MYSNQLLSTSKFVVLKASPDLEIWSCSSKADDLERLPIHRYPCEVSSSLPFRRLLTLIAKGIDDCVPHSRRFGPSLSLPSIHSYSSYDALHCKSKHPIRRVIILGTFHLVTQVDTNIILSLTFNE